MNLNETSIVMTFQPLSAPQRRGVIVVAVFALLSALALVFIALRTIRVALMFLRRDGAMSLPPEILFFRTQLGHYAGCLILSNMLMSIAGLINFGWVSRSGLSQGPTCSAQATLMQIGIWGTCWFTAAIGVRILTSLGFRICPSRCRSVVGVVLGWIVAFIAALLPLRQSDVYGPAGTSCSITPSHPKDMFGLEALPIILGTFVSTTAYSVIFIVLRGKLSVSSTQQPRGPSSAVGRGENVFEEYDKFIDVIIRTMFWFPFAFVFLLLPFCVTHILMFAGQWVSSAPSVFADVCVSMLGFVNVVLLGNTFRVISPAYLRTAEGAETVKTFGHDSSGESPIAPPQPIILQPTIQTYENSHQTYKPTHSSLNHTYNTSWASADSNTGFLPARKARYEGIQEKATPLVLRSVIHPAAPGRVSAVVFLQDNPKKQVTGLYSEEMHVASPHPHPFRAPFATGDVSHEPLPRENYISQPAEAADTFTKGAKKPTFKSKAPPALDLSCSLASRSGVNAGTRSPPSFFASMETPSTDSESKYSQETARPYLNRPLPRIPEPSDDEQTVETGLQRVSGSYKTVDTVWSQETGYTSGQFLDLESEGHTTATSHS